jgi:hypothetical protein
MKGELTIMKNRKNILIIGISTILVLSFIIVLILVWRRVQGKDVSVLYEGFDEEFLIGRITLPEDVVPAEDVLISNLEKKGYQIETFDVALNSDISANRVLAKKGKSFIDICYGLDATNVNDVFSEYKDVYFDTNYYILAQNGYYVYCISDKKTLKRSGFNGTANIGVQYKK